MACNSAVRPMISTAVVELLVIQTDRLDRSGLAICRDRPQRSGGCCRPSAGSGGGRLWLAQARRVGERLCLVSSLPGQVEIRAAEVAVGRCLAVDRCSKAKRVDDRPGTKVEVLVDEAEYSLVGKLARPVRLDRDRDGLGNADRVAQLELEPVGKTRGDDIFGHPTRC